MGNSEVGHLNIGAGRIVHMDITRLDLMIQNGEFFSHPMLVEAGRKLVAGRRGSALIEADALALPLPDASLDLVTAAFGFRNLANYRTGLAELRRVLRPGGTAAILEFSQPSIPGFAPLYALYAGRVLPYIGGLISGDRSAYTYLPESVRRFPGPEELAAQMTDAGFASVQFERMTGGIVALHIGTAA
jgi:demethylmenaquinone methyltransferase/2-methoxy-6-polyprenyl-1,4-benzoquinol methylase